MAKKLTLDNLVQKQGTFEQQCLALNGSAWLTSAEIQSLRALNNRKGEPKHPELRKYWFRAGDGAVYQKNNSGNFIMYVTSSDINPILKRENVKGAVSQIRDTGNYKVNNSDLGVIVTASEKNDGRVTAIDLSKLSSKKFDAEWSYIEFSTKMNKKTQTYKGLENAEDLKLAKDYHGKGKQFDRTMKMLADAKIKTTRVYFLSQEYLTKNADNQPIARLSALYIFNINSNADAGGRYIDDINAFAFGVPVNAAEGGRFDKIGHEMDVNKAIAYLKKHRKEITSDTAKDLLGIADAYYQKN